MTPPGEINMINQDRAVFRARISQRDGVAGKEYLYNPSKGAFQYRLIIPSIGDSMIVQDVTENELRQYLLTGKPVLIRSAASD
jgi:hypothetical protein